MQPDRLHPLDFRGITPPRRFTYPFAYQPHPLVCLAADELMKEIKRRPEWTNELGEGKMLGVLVVKEGGYLAAFSGTLGGRSDLPFFVPPVFDLHTPGCHFQAEEQAISAINRHISLMERDEEVQNLQSKLHALQEASEAEIRRFSEQMAFDRQQRHLLRQTALSLPEQEALIRESQHQKAELKRLRAAWKQRIAEQQTQLDERLAPIRALKEERARRSAQLQQWLFEKFTFLNAEGHTRSLSDIFMGQTPPAAAGECCAPRLLQYAYTHRFRPLCMGEFWVGRSPAGAPRVHGHFYPSCQSRCHPILSWMLRGLDVDPNPMALRAQELVKQLRVVYADAHIVVVDKPSGLLSVPGKDDLPSVQSIIAERYAHEGPMIVHRLDMDTSGLMVVALTTDAYHHLQQQFLTRTVEKRYRARVSRPLTPGQEGDISLPLAVNPDDRPRQMVSEQYGKPALTHYRVLSPHHVLLWPHTGRTHQLRLHLAHPRGLGSPITGDTLYGSPANRLHLCADSLSFTHPATGERLHFRLDHEPF